VGRAENVGTAAGGDTRGAVRFGVTRGMDGCGTGCGGVMSVAGLAMAPRRPSARASPAAAGWAIMDAGSTCIAVRITLRARTPVVVFRSVTWLSCLISI